MESADRQSGTNTTHISNVKDQEQLRSKTSLAEQFLKKINSDYQIIDSFYQKSLESLKRSKIESLLNFSEAEKQKLTQNQRNIIDKITQLNHAPLSSSLQSQIQQYFISNNKSNRITNQNSIIQNTLNENLNKQYFKILLKQSHCSVLEIDGEEIKDWESITDYSRVTGLHLDLLLLKIFEFLPKICPQLKRITLKPSQLVVSNNYLQSVQSNDLSSYQRMFYLVSQNKKLEQFNLKGYQMIINSTTLIKFYCSHPQIKSIILQNINKNNLIQLFYSRRNIEKLSLKNNNTLITIDEDFLNFLYKTNPQLKQISIETQEYTASVIKVLTKFQNLQKINLDKSATIITYTHYTGGIGNHTIQNTKPQFEGFIKLLFTKSCPKLKHLHFLLCALQDKDIQILVQFLPSIENLKLILKDTHSTIAFKCLTSFSKLKHLDLQFKVNQANCIQVLSENRFQLLTLSLKSDTFQQLRHNINTLDYTQQKPKLTYQSFLKTQHKLQKLQIIDKNYQQSFKSIALNIAHMKNLKDLLIDSVADININFCPPFCSIYYISKLRNLQRAVFCRTNMIISPHFIKLVRNNKKLKFDLGIKFTNKKTARNLFILNSISSDQNIRIFQYTHVYRELDNYNFNQYILPPPRQVYY